ncbi:unnamed protein product [Diatraea saccharalis]|uniref:Uncharacterized protein n=1 Tax=Diatraea saccharalis TaxID=40085 RepID=A0A9N9WHT0_9NEOP|nr:unnamed protein product [Diatraea saccharalis]
MDRSRKYFLFIAIQLIYAISGQEVQKRVPQGFLGMRGKKFESESTEQFYKRKPQFFVGVKGKKNIFDLLDSEEKRGPMGFVGMRGKKEFFLPETYPGYELGPKRGSLIGQIDYTSSDENDQINYDFPLFRELLNKYLQKAEETEQTTEIPDTGEEYERISNEVDKRAANIHQFFGVRGKKSIQNKRPYDLTFRGKFIGVRGKKDLKNSGAHEIRFLLGSNSPWPKRRTQMGFVGMRGKKWTDVYDYLAWIYSYNQLIYAISGQEVQKRVPQGFLGMRGKKFESESTEQFYKRKPQFFVGVKGKKNIFDLLDSEEKRGPMGFVGMRGKKEFFLPETYPGYELGPKRGSLIGQIDYTSSDENDQINYDFPLFRELLNKYLQKAEETEQTTEIPDTGEEYERISNEVDKRAANIHQFFGVRGKKSIQNKRPYDLTFRGKFIGVRGKKDLKNSGAHEIRFLLGSNSPWPKRRTQMGFVGMRGKKWTDESSLEGDLPN